MSTALTAVWPLLGFHVVNYTFEYVLLQELGNLWFEVMLHGGSDVGAYESGWGHFTEPSVLGLATLLCSGSSILVWVRGYNRLG